jgi:hypothetical protein
MERAQRLALGLRRSHAPVRACATRHDPDTVPDA